MTKSNKQPKFTKPKKELSQEEIDRKSLLNRAQQRATFYGKLKEKYHTSGNLQGMYNKIGECYFSSNIENLIAHLNRLGKLGQCYYFSNI